MLCPWCDTEIIRKPEETSGNFKKRKYCSQKCNARHREAKRADRKKVEKRVDS